MAAPGYAHLLTHLQKTASTLPLPTIQAALAHHLATLSPLPTPLAAIAVSAPLFTVQPIPHQKLQALFTAFRHAVHIRFRDAQKIDEKRSLVDAAFARNINVRLALWATAVLNGIKGGQPLLRLACCGGLLAGLEDLRVGTNRSRIEDEVVICVAEVMDLYSGTGSSWESEFKPTGDVDRISLALILASQSLVFVAPSRLKALPLAVLLDLLTFTITSTFATGAFLDTQTLRRVNDSPLMDSISSLSKLTALVITVLCDSRPDEGVPSTRATLEAFLGMARAIERGWEKSAESTLVWNTLKTLLFAHIMISDAALSALVYIPSPPSSLALAVLHTLHHLSFVVSQFAGDECDVFIRELVAATDRRNLAKTAYTLTCIEQLVRVLSDECVRSCALPLALPFLSSPAQRETYESAHSLVLSVFSAHADRAENAWVSRMVPFYAECLIKNSFDDQLSTAQLRLAYAALVRYGAAADDVLAWYCVEQLLDAITASRDDRRHRLHLTLVSMILAAQDSQELFDAAFSEVSERIGDTQRATAMEWWYNVSRERSARDAPQARL
ncbi:hypothetical protein MKEN_01406800 [Mycena kentingensis (nom. inval.)]|nr:hypothetical protein MKEN_01406800 [Mycena kentingensis (nom. inval.)]